MLYRVTYEFINEYGEQVATFLDNCGEGFTEADALDIVRQLKYMGHKNVELEEMPDDDDILIAAWLEEEEAEKYGK